MAEGTWEKLSQVAVLGAEYDSPERYPHPKCLEGTRVDLLKYIYKVLDNQKKSRLIWLHGTAGVGKSAVAFTVAERMMALTVTEETKIETRLAGTFFFSRKHTKCSTTGYFFATLAYQLAINFPSVKNDVNRAIRENPAVLGPSKSLRDQMKALFRQPLWHLETRLRECSPPMFVVDALDECKPETVADLISLLGEALRDPDLPVFHILLTSRSEEHIRRAIQRQEMRPLVCEIPVNTSGEGVTATISLDGEDVDNDIYIFLQHSFTELRRHPDFPQPTADELARLASRAGRRFIVASTMIKFIDDGYNDPRHRLKQLLRLTDKLPPGTEVYELYDRILSTCTDPIRAYLHLSIVVALADPLPISQISKLLGPGQGKDVEKTLIQLRSVVDIPTDSNLPLNIYHSSVRDYVSDPSNCKLSQIRPITSPHSLLAECSFHLMMQDIPESTGLLDALLALKEFNKAMHTEDPKNLQQSLAFIIEPPEPLHALTSLLWLRGARGSGLRSWLETSDGHAWLRTHGGEDYLRTQKGEDWLGTRGGSNWLHTHAGDTWLHTERGRSWLQSEEGWLWNVRQRHAGDPGKKMLLEALSGQDTLETIGEQDWFQTLAGRDWLQTKNGREWVQTHTGGEWLKTLAGREWLQTSSGRGWLHEQELLGSSRQEGPNTKNGREWLDTKGGREWLGTKGGRERLDTESGREWLDTKGGREWLDTKGGREWLDSERAQAWLNTWRGREWLNASGGWRGVDIRRRLYTKSGRDWLDTESGRDWLDTESGRDWLQPDSGSGWLRRRKQWQQIKRGNGWLQTPSGQQWLQTRSGQEWLETQGGKEWLQLTTAGREWVENSSGREWLKTQSGQDWLQAQQSGIDWLPTSSRRDWLQTQTGRDWLQTWRGRDWLQRTHSGQEWLQTRIGREWLSTDDGREWLRTHNGQEWLQTHNGQEWLQTHSARNWLGSRSGNQWLQTLMGREWLQTYDGQAWLHTKDAWRNWTGHWLDNWRGREWLLTQSGREWLLTQNGEKWFLTSRGREWLQSPAGREWLQTSDGLQTKSGQEWLQTKSGRDWLLDKSRRERLQTEGGQQWLQTHSGQEWLQTSDGQAWRLTPAASVWVTMEDFSNTLQTIHEYAIIPRLPLPPTFQVIHEFKSLPDFLMFPVFLALRPQDPSTSTHLQDYPDIEVIHAMIAFNTFATEARERSQSTSDALKYACQNWAVHLLRARTPNDELGRIFNSFWNQHLLAWLERQWCLKGLRSCLVILSEGQKLAKERLVEVAGSSQSQV